MLDCHDQRLPRRSLTVMMVHESDSVPASVLEVDVRPAPLCVDRTFRFHAAEHEFFKQRLKLPHADAAVDTGPGGASAAELTAVCSEATAVVGCTAAEAGGVQDEVRPRLKCTKRQTASILLWCMCGAQWCLLTVSGVTTAAQVYLKVKCGAAPTTSELFVLLYRDRFCARLVATWQVFVHSLRRTDMTAVVGQTTQSSVVNPFCVSRTIIIAHPQLDPSTVR
jgi:nephrocystin-4